MTTKQQQTNPFVYVIAAVVLAVLAYGLKYSVDSLETNNASIEQETEVKNYLAPRKVEEDKTPLTSTGSATGTTAPLTSTGSTTGTTTPSGSVAQ